MLQLVLHSWKKLCSLCHVLGRYAAVCAALLVEALQFLPRVRDVVVSAVQLVETL